MESIAKEFEKHANERPDQWTLAWWREQFREVVQGYRGATHAVNRAIAELCDAREEAAKCKAKCEQLEKQAEADRAKIGELSARVDKIAAFANEIRAERDGKAKGK